MFLNYLLVLIPIVISVFDHHVKLLMARLQVIVEGLDLMKFTSIQVKQVLFHRGLYSSFAIEV